MTQEEVMKLKPGDRVKIVNKWNAACFQSPTGEMDIYLGMVVHVLNVGKVYIRISEDNGRWIWFPASLDRVVDKNSLCGVFEDDNAYAEWRAGLDIMSLL